MAQWPTKFFAMLLLSVALPSLLWAEVTVKHVKKPVQPANTIERVSKRKPNAVIYEHGGLGTGVFSATIGTKRLTYLDSLGQRKLIDLAEKPATTPGFEKRVDMGMTVFEYDNAGRIRYERKGEWIVVTPLFNTNAIKSELSFETDQLKATYEIKKNADLTYKWRVDEAWVGLSRQKIVPFVAWDDRGAKVPVTTEFRGDTLIASMTPPPGAIYPLHLDPTFKDTAHAADTVVIAVTANAQTEAKWDSLRQVVAGVASSHPTTGYAFATNDGTSILLRRSPTYFDLTSITTAVSIDSAILSMQVGVYGGTDTIHVVQANFTGPSPKAADFNNFTGWTADSTSAYSVVEYIDAIVTSETTPTNAPKYVNAAGLAAIDSLVGDTLRIFVLTHPDVANKTPTGANKHYDTVVFGSSYLTVYYTEGNQPGLSEMQADTLRYVQHILYAEIDSTGGLNLSVRGFQSFLYGDNTDTTAVSDTGSYTAGVFSHISPPWLPDTSYVTRAFGINTKGTSYGVWDTLSTALPGGGTDIYIDGRIVTGVH